jgi:hypothetical protein
MFGRTRGRPKKAVIVCDVPATVANWGAKETPRHCRNQGCKSVNSRVHTTNRLTSPPRTIRYRECLDCGQRYSTVEAE